MPIEKKPKPASATANGIKVPKDLFQQNEKLAASGIHNWGIPAWKDAKGQMICINAGKCGDLALCYAQHGNYERFLTTAKAQQLRYELSKSPEFKDIVNAAIKKQKVKILRVHDSGDFYSPKYLKDWMEVAKSNPGTHFYAYTKMVSWLKKLEAEGGVPSNFRIIFSLGGTEDNSIDMKSDRHSRVFKDVASLLAEGYEDCHEVDLPAAIGDNPKVGLVAHNAGKEGAKVWHELGEAAAKGFIDPKEEDEAMPDVPRQVKRAKHEKIFKEAFEKALKEKRPIGECVDMGYEALAAYGRNVKKEADEAKAAKKTEREAKKLAKTAPKPPEIQSSLQALLGKIEVKGSSLTTFLKKIEVTAAADKFWHHNPLVMQGFSSKEDALEMVQEVFPNAQYKSGKVPEITARGSFEIADIEKWNVVKSGETMFDGGNYLGTYDTSRNLFDYTHALPAQAGAPGEDWGLSGLFSNYQESRNSKGSKAKIIEILRRAKDAPGAKEALKKVLNRDLDQEIKQADALGDYGPSDLAFQFMQEIVKPKKAPEPIVTKITDNSSARPELKKIRDMVLKQLKSEKADAGLLKAVSFGYYDAFLDDWGKDSKKTPIKTLTKDITLNYHLAPPEAPRPPQKAEFPTKPGFLRLFVREGSGTSNDYKHGWIFFPTKGPFTAQALLTAAVKQLPDGTFDYRWEEDPSTIKESAYTVTEHPGYGIIKREWFVQSKKYEDDYYSFSEYKKDDGGGGGDDEGESAPPPGAPSTPEQILNAPPLGETERNKVPQKVREKALASLRARQLARRVKATAMPVVDRRGPKELSSEELFIRRSQLIAALPRAKDLTEERILRTRIAIIEKEMLRRSNP